MHMHALSYAVGCCTLSYCPAGTSQSSISQHRVYTILISGQRGQQLTVDESVPDATLMWSVMTMPEDWNTVIPNHIIPLLTRTSDKNSTNRFVKVVNKIYLHRLQIADCCLTCISTTPLRSPSPSKFGGL